MPPENDPTLNTNAPAPAEAAPAALEAAPAVDTSVASGKVVQMPSAAIAKMRREEREKGKRALQAELDASAKKLGFESHAALVAAAEAAKKAPPAKPQTQARPQQRVVPAARVEKDKAVREAEIIKARRAAAVAEKRLRRERRATQKLQAEYALREAAVRSGISDPEFALHLLRKQMQGKTQQELAGFDESKFFAGLRDTHAYLFGVTVQPATTSPGKKGEAAAAPAPKGLEAPPAPTTPDARKMSREEYNEHLAKLGIRNPAMGFSH